MKTDKLLDKTVRKDGEAKKWKVYAVVIVGVLIAGGLFVGGMFLIEPIINEYLENGKDIVAVYDFLDLKVGLNQTAVYFIGSSIVGCGIDSNEINRILQEKGYNITVYNIAIDGTSPRQRSLLNQNIIDSNPSLVIIGESYAMATGNQSLNDERIFVVSDKLKIRNDSLYLYSDDELSIINTKPSLYENKRFIKGALKYYFLNGHPKIDLKNTTDLYTVAFSKNWRYNEENNPNYNHQGIIDEANKGSWSPVITTDMNPAKEAIEYNAKTLINSGIPVIILNMPLHPLISQHVTDESRQNFFDFLNTTGATWYDYEYSCPDDNYWYKDGHHIAPVTGAKLFAPRMADLIIEQVENDVIHYT